MSRPRCASILALALLGLAVLRAEEAPKPSAMSPEELAPLVARLGDPAFEKREEAYQRLVEAPGELDDALLEARTATTDPEIQTRLLEAVWARRARLAARYLRCPESEVQMAEGTGPEGIEAALFYRTRYPLGEPVDVWMWLRNATAKRKTIHWDTVKIEHVSGMGGGHNPSAALRTGLRSSPSRRSSS